MTSNNRSSSSLGLPVPQDEPCDDTTSRSELKRRREKQRRLDVRMAFEELSTIISLIDPGMVNIDAGRKRRKKTSDQDNANRVEIIHRATKIMRRLHHENEATKQMLTQMRNTTHHRYTDEGVSSPFALRNQGSGLSPGSNEVTLPEAGFVSQSSCIVLS